MAMSSGPSVKVFEMPLIKLTAVQGAFLDNAPRNGVMGIRKHLGVQSRFRRLGQRPCGARPIVLLYHWHGRLTAQLAFPRRPGTRVEACNADRL